MRALALLLLALSLTTAELEQITLTDGRRLIGYYDEAAGRLTVEGPPKAVISVAAGQVAARTPYLRAPNTDPTKQSEAEIVRLEAERDAALAEADRMRKFASARSGKDAEVATSQANEQISRATALTEKIDAAKARLAAAKPVAVRPVSPAPTASNANDKWERALQDADALHVQYINLRFNATVEWLRSQNTAPLIPPAIGEDPRQSEIDARDKAVNESRKRARLAKLLKESEAITDPDQRDEWVKDVLSIVRRPARGE